VKTQLQGVIGLYIVKAELNITRLCQSGAIWRTARLLASTAIRWYRY